MKKAISWIKFKIGGHDPKEDMDLFDEDDEDDDEEDSPWAKKEEVKYNTKTNTDKLEEIINRNRVLQTPLGVINADGSEESLKLFNVWSGHTNFVLTEQQYSIIEKVPGVEALQPISQYRFQIAVGFLFDENQVKADVEEALLGSARLDAIELLKVYRFANPTLTKDISKRLEVATKDINKIWVAFVHPNGEVKMVVGDRVDDQFLEELTLIGLAQTLYTGYIDSSLLRPSG